MSKQAMGNERRGGAILLAHGTGQTPLAPAGTIDREEKSAHRRLNSIYSFLFIDAGEMAHDGTAGRLAGRKDRPAAMS